METVCCPGVVAHGDGGKSISLTLFFKVEPDLFVCSKHHRYVGKTHDYRGTYIASEAPVLLRDVTLIDPSDRYTNLHTPSPTSLIKIVKSVTSRITAVLLIVQRIKNVYFL